MNPKSTSNKFHSRGKLLLTGEYVVLDGAKALAVPTKFGQEMKVLPIDEKQIEWTALDENGKTWFEEAFLVKSETNPKSPDNRTTIKIKSGKINPTALRLKKILMEANRVNPSILRKNKGFHVVTKTGFPQNWGLGTSSTLLNNIAQWFEIDAFGLSEKTLGGSGYDIACAQRDTPILYQLRGGKPKIEEVEFNPKFKENLFFVHLNQKQDSRKAIQHYRHQDKRELKKAIAEISSLTDAFLACDELGEFEKLMAEHEKTIGSLLNMEPIKTRLFKDYPHAVKSLGGWGGDFVLAVGEEGEMEYFREKGFRTVLGFSEMI